MTPKAKTPDPPAHLGDASRIWWRGVCENYALEPHHVRLLTLAAESWDRGEQARAALASAGLTYIDRFDQPHARPEVAIERDNRIAFARLVRELGLDLAEPEAPKPPPVASRRRY